MYLRNLLYTLSITGQVGSTPKSHATRWAQPKPEKTTAHRTGGGHRKLSLHADKADSGSQTDTGTLVYHDAHPMHPVHLSCKRGTGGPSGQKKSKWALKTCRSGLKGRDKVGAAKVSLLVESGTVKQPICTHIEEHLKGKGMEDKADGGMRFKSQQFSATA